MTDTRLAKRLERIKPSPTLAIAKLARERKAAGEDIISLSAGEPDFDTPGHICDAAVAAIRRGETRYTNVDGTAELKAAVRDKFRRDNRLEFSDDEIIVSTGGKQVLYNALMAAVSPGDEVVILAPYWVSYPDMALLAEAEVKIVECPGPDFYPDPDDLARALSAKTRMLILNNPSNPSGALWSRAQQHAIAEVVKEHPRVYVMSDEIYEKIVYEDDGFTAFAEAAGDVAPEVAARTLTVNGVSKAYAMTGWRIGFAGGPRDLVRAMAKLQSQSTSNPSSVSQAAAVAALSGSEDFIPERTGAFLRRRDLVVSALNGIDGISCPQPGGAFYVYPSCAGVLGKKTPQGGILETDSDFATYLLESVGVALVPGVAFGLSPHFRISYATDDDTLKEACGRIAKAVSDLA